MATRRKPVVRLRRYDREDEVTILEFLTDRMVYIEHSIARCQEMVACERSKYTINQLNFFRNSQSNMLWLLNTLSLFRNSSPDKLASIMVDRISRRVANTRLPRVK